MNVYIFYILVRRQDYVPCQESLTKMWIGWLCMKEVQAELATQSIEDSVAFLEHCETSKFVHENDNCSPMMMKALKKKIEYAAAMSSSSNITCFSIVCCGYSALRFEYLPSIFFYRCRHWQNGSSTLLRHHLSIRDSLDQNNRTTVP